MTPVPESALSLLALLSLLPVADAADWKPGATIDNAAAADITPEGFDAIAGVIPTLLPSQIDVPDTGADEGYYAYSLTNGWAGIQVVSADIQPGNGVLDVTADLLVNVNNSSDKFDLSYEVVWIISDECPGYVDPFPVHIHTTMGLAVVEGEDGAPRLDATVGAIELTYDVSGDNFHLDCSTADVIDFFRDYLGLDFYDYVLGLVGDQLTSTVADLGPTIETTIEDAFSQATIVQDLDLNGAAAHIELYPSDVDITPAGVRVTMAGSVAADAAECIADYDPGSSLATPSEAPAIGSAPDGVYTPYHVGIDVSDDFANSALYSLWRGGLLCYALDENGVFPLDTGIVGGLTGDVFAAYFPTPQPVVMRTVPRGVPTVDYEGDHDINLALSNLDLDFFAEIDGRQARFVSMTLNGPVGADLALDGATGNLAVELAIVPEELSPTVGYNELEPDQNDAILADFGGGLASLLDVALGQLVGSLAFAIPSFSGIGLQELEVAAAGSNADWLGAYARVGTVTYSDGSGCGGCGGTGDTGTDTGSSSSSGCGCATTNGIPNVAFALIPMGLALVLRRRE